MPQTFRFTASEIDPPAPPPSSRFVFRAEDIDVYDPLDDPFAIRARDPDPVPRPISPPRVTPPPMRMVSSHRPPGAAGNDLQSALRQVLPAMAVSHETQPEPDPAAAFSRATGISAQPQRSVLDIAANAPRAAAAGLVRGNQAVWGGLRAAADVLGLDSVAEWARAAGQGATELAETVRGPQTGASPTEQAVLGGFESIGASALPLAAGVVSGQPSVALGMMGAQTGGEAYQQARNAKVNTPEALAFAVSQGAVEVATERIPAGRLLGDLAKRTGLLKTIIRQATAEIPSEQIATALQDLNEWATLQPDKPLSAYLEERPSAAAQTLISTLVATIGQTAASAGVERVTRPRERVQPSSPAAIVPAPIVESRPSPVAPIAPPVAAGPSTVARLTDAAPVVEPAPPLGVVSFTADQIDQPIVAPSIVERAQQMRAEDPTIDARAREMAERARAAKVSVVEPEGAQLIAAIEDLSAELDQPYGDRDVLAGLLDTDPEDFSASDVQLLREVLADLQDQQAKRGVLRQLSPQEEPRALETRQESESREPEYSGTESERQAAEAGRGDRLEQRPSAPVAEETPVARAVIQSEIDRLTEENARLAKGPPPLRPKKRTATPVVERSPSVDESRITPSEPPSIAGLIELKEAEVTSGALAETPASAAAEVRAEVGRVVDLRGVKSAADVQRRVVATLTEELEHAKVGAPVLEVRPQKAYGGREFTVFADGEPLVMVDRYGHMKASYGVDDDRVKALSGAPVALGRTGDKASLGQIDRAKDMSKPELYRYAQAEISRRLGQQRGTVTVQIPGDGTFTINRTPEAVSEVLRRITKAGVSPWKGLKGEGPPPLRKSIPGVTPITDVVATPEPVSTEPTVRNPGFIPRGEVRVVEPKPQKIATEPTGGPPGVSLNDIPMDLAIRAHSGTSHTPEVRAKSEQEGYVSHMTHVWNEIQKLAKTDEQKAIARAEFARYRSGYLERNRAYMSARSGVVSAYIAGPSKFPSRQMEKRNNAVDKRRNEFVEWEQRALRAMREAIEPSVARSISSDRSDAVEALQAKIDAAKKQQELMRTVNAIVRTKATDAEKIAKITAATGFKEATAAKLLEPDFMGRKGFPDYELTNNAANIRRMEARIGEVSAQKAKPEGEAMFDGGRVEENASLNRIQIFFDSKPDEATRDKLKANGFHWSPREGAWQRQRNDAGREAVRKVLGVTLGERVASGEPEGAVAKLQAVEDAAKARIKDRGTFKGSRLTAGLPVDDIADLVIIGAARIAKGTVQFAQWSAEMVRDFGDAIRPHLQTIYDRAKVKAAEFGPRPILADTGRDIPDQQRLPKDRVLAFPSLQKMPEAIRGDIADMLERYNGFETQRRGVQPIARTQEIAKDLWLPLETLKPGTALNAEELEAYKTALATALTERQKVLEKIKDGTATDWDRLQFSHLTDVATILTASYRGAKAEAGRALNILRVKARVLDLQESRFLEAALKAPGFQSDISAVAKAATEAEGDPLAQLRLLRKRAAGNWFDLVQAAYYTNLLSGLKTHLRNAIGNSFNTFANTIAPIGGAAADIVRATATGQPRTVFIGEIRENLAGGFIGLDRGMKNAAFTFREGFRPSTVESAAGGVFDTPRVELPGGVWTNWPSRALEAADEFFRAIAYQQELHAGAYADARGEGLRKPDEIHARMAELMTAVDGEDGKTFAELRDRAQTFAARAVFQEEPGPIVNWLLKAKAPTSPIPLRAAALFVSPFIKTPSAILRQGAEWSPVGFVMKGAKQGGREGAQALGRAGLGTGFILGPLAWFAANGLLTGAPPDDEGEREEFYAQGKLGNAIKIGEYWVRYTLFQPYSVSMAAVANAWQQFQESKQDETAVAEAFAGAVAGAGASLLDQSFLAGLGTVIDAVNDPQRYAGQWLSLFVQGLVPYSGAMRNITQAIDPVVRKPSGVAESVQAIIPWMSSSLQPKRTRFGEAVTRPGSAVQRGFIVPEVSKAVSDDVTTILARLQIQPTTPRARFTVNGKPVELTREQQDIVTEAIGRERKATIERVISSPFFKGLKDESQRAGLERAINSVTDRVRPNVIRTLAMKRELTVSNLVSPAVREQMQKDQAAVRRLVSTPLQKTGTH